MRSRLTHDSQNRRCKEGMMGKAEGQGTQKGHACLQKIHCSEADECGHAEETVGDDEGKVGGEEEGGVSASPKHKSARNGNGRSLYTHPRNGSAQLRPARTRTSW